METMEIITKLSNLGYRVVPDWISYNRCYEIIVEPWDYVLNKKRPGRVKRTGFYFSPSEINRPGESDYIKKLTEVQLKLINHFHAKIIK